MHQSSRTAVRRGAMVWAVSVQPRDRPAPGRLELIRTLVNTLDLDSGADGLADAPGARAWLVAGGLLDPAARLTRSDLARVRRAREAFRLVLIAHAVGGPAEDAVAFLNEIAADAKLSMRFSGPGDAVPVVAGSSLDGALGQLTATALQAVFDGRWARLKACPARNCHWAFYDLSRNRSSRWCDMGVCGNRSKRESRRARRAP